MTRRADERPGIAGKIRGKKRRDLVAQKVARALAVGIALVVDPREPARHGVRDERRACQFEQRSQQGRAAGAMPWHRRQTLRTGATQ